ncbi:MAG: hypothetical protein FWE23_03025 [Chitinivibrionia bacterium]|nr:hypothetical protein [Chitinivibrionia bacterium]
MRGITKIVFMANDDRPQGGMTDRFRAMTALYKICKECGFQFKINHTVPFDLSDYLHPNYDWKISENQIQENKEKSVSLSYFEGWWAVESKQYSDTIQYAGRLTCKEVITILKDLSASYEYILFYTNMSFFQKEYGCLFNELFHLSTELQDVIDFHRNKMNNDYFTAVFRFQNLLDDFDEFSEFPTLPAELQEVFIQQNINHLIKIHKRNKDRKILVCSDSVRFRNAAAMYDFVYTIGEKRQHTCNSKIEKQSVLLSFVDYFLISYSSKVFLIVDKVKNKNKKYQSYRSQFPYWASRHRNVDYVVIDYRIKEALKQIMKKIVPLILREYSIKFMGLTKFYKKTVFSYFAC